MEVVSARSVSSLNPYAAPYVPAAFRAVEDFSDEWWELVRSTPWFRDYWLRECFQEENETENDPDFVDILDPATDDFLFHSNPPQQDDEEEKWVKSKLELVKLGAEKWRGPRMGAVGPRRCDKAPKIVSVKVSPRMIQQPR